MHIEHVHLSNNRMKLTVCGTLALDSDRRRSHTAAYAGR